MHIKGYKAFNKDKTNRYGITFEEGKTYQIEGEIRFGNQGNGYHICTHLCDVFRYVNCKEGIEVALVLGSGKVHHYDDEYYGYYDMFAVEQMTILRFLSREEILAYALKMHELDSKKFLSSFQLTDEEKRVFIKKYQNNYAMLMFLSFYQLGAKKNI